MMEEYFRNIVDLKFTANMETDLDKIEAGKMAWKDVLREYYKDFDANLNTPRSSSRASISRCRMRSRTRSASELRAQARV